MAKKYKTKPTSKYSYKKKDKKSFKRYKQISNWEKPYTRDFSFDVPLNNYYDSSVTVGQCYYSFATTGISQYYDLLFLIVQQKSFQQTMFDFQYFQIKGISVSFQPYNSSSNVNSSLGSLSVLTTADMYIDIIPGLNEFSLLPGPNIELLPFENHPYIFRTNTLSNPLTSFYFPFKRPLGGRKGLSTVGYPLSCQDVWTQTNDYTQSTRDYFLNVLIANRAPSYVSSTATTGTFSRMGVLRFKFYVTFTKPLNWKTYYSVPPLEFDVSETKTIKDALMDLELQRNYNRFQPCYQTDNCKVGLNKK